jgi:hypothetical protein
VAVLLVAVATALAGGAATAQRWGARAAGTPVPDTAPVTVSPAGVGALSRRFGVPIFWAGPQPGMRYEVRRSRGNVYLRYLPKNVPAGTPENGFLTVVTYPLAGGYRKLTTIASYRAVPVASGGTALVDEAQPGSVHLAFPRFAGYQVEVYDLPPSLSLKLALSGKVRPVDGSAVADADPSDAVSRWIALAYNETGVHSLDAPRLWRSMALVSVAVEDAVLGVPKAEAPAAAAGAAESVLAYLYPDQRELFSAAAAPAAGNRRGFAFGRSIAARAIARARDDGSSRRWSGVVPATKGLWVRTPSQFLAPIEALAGSWRTWLLASGGSAQPPPPPKPGTSAYRRGLREVYDLSRHLTPAQTNLALYWAADPRWPRIAISSVSAGHLAPAAAARIYGTFFAAEADALIACWATKYRYWEARPVTVIRRELDPRWSPLVETPAFPSYTAAHAVLSGTAAVVLGRFFPSKSSYFDRQAKLCSLSRVYAGIHFPFDTDAGLAQGRRIGKIALTRRTSLETLLR